MARIARKYLESSYFHVIVQGFEKQFIFNDDYFKQKYLRLLFEKLPEYKVEILEYCIMGNHAHILLFCDNNREMSLYMQKVNSLYATFYNKKLGRVGYVFRDRFLSEPIMNEKHLYDCVPYIHMNPVVAGMVRNPGDYKYSSYNDFVYKRGIATDSVLQKLFGSKDNYMELFNFMHFANGSGIEYKNDTPKKNMIEARNIIFDILKECSIFNLKNETIELQRYFYKRFLREGITVYQIEKILKIDHKKVKSIIKL